MTTRQASVALTVVTSVLVISTLVLDHDRPGWICGSGLLVTGLILLPIEILLTIATFKSPHISSRRLFTLLLLGCTLGYAFGLLVFMKDCG
jgi:hypothetical protein